MKSKTEHLSPELLESCGWTPLHTRAISHRIGDGTVNFYGRAVWDNKHPSELISLIEHLGIKVWKPSISDKYGTA